MLQPWTLSRPSSRGLGRWRFAIKVSGVAAVVPTATNDPERGRASESAPLHPGAVMWSPPPFPGLEQENTVKTRYVLFVLSLATVCAFSGAGHAELFKWVDENGKTHYGDQVPERYQQKQQSLKVDKAPSQADRDAALQRIQKEKNTANALKAQREAKSGAVVKPVKAGAGEVPNETACQKEWRLFHEGMACFAPFRTANRSIRAEAYQHCKEMTEPKSICPP